MTRSIDRTTNTNTNTKAVFICGCGRSGTTYLRTIIDAHPKIFIPTESLFLVDYLLYEKYVPKALLSMIFFREPQLRAWYSGPLFKITNMRDAVIKIHNHAAEEKGAQIWGQKTPRFVRSMDLFNKHLEGIKWILVYRDPRAVTASMLKSKRHTYMISRACRRWNKDNKYIIEILSFPERRGDVFIIKYEDLINNFEDCLKDIYNFLCVAPIQKDEVISRGKVLNLKGSRFEGISIRNGLTPRKEIIDSWKTYLNSEQIRKVELLCAEGMEKLGYLPIFKSEKENIVLGVSDFVAFFEDFLILLEYSKKWPSYLFYTAVRKTLFIVCYWICRIGGKA